MNDLTALSAVEHAAEALDAPGDAGLDADDKAGMVALIESAAVGFTLELVMVGGDIDRAIDDHADVERDADRIQLRQAVGALSDTQRAVIERHTYAGETFEEIAESTGMKRSTVFDLYTRGVERLREELGEGQTEAP